MASPDFNRVFAWRYTREEDTGGHAGITADEDFTAPSDRRLPVEPQLKDARGVLRFLLSFGRAARPGDFQRGRFDDCVLPHRVDEAEIFAFDDRARDARLLDFLNIGKVE